MSVLVGCVQQACRLYQPRSLHIRSSSSAMVKTSVVTGRQLAVPSNSSDLGSKVPVASRKRDRFSTFAASLTHSQSAGEVSTS